MATRVCIDEIVSKLQSIRRTADPDRPMGRTAEDRLQLIWLTAESALSNIDRQVNEQGEIDAEMEAQIRDVLEGKRAADARHAGYIHLIPEYENKRVAALPYDQFLASPFWWLVRLAVFRRDRNSCVSCGKSCDKLHCHHVNYGRHGYENLYLHQLKTLCGDCHAAIHGK